MREGRAPETPTPLDARAVCLAHGHARGVLAERAGGRRGGDCSSGQQDCPGEVWAEAGFTGGEGYVGSGVNEGKHITDTYLFSQFIEDAEEAKI